jgi:hypothetical protein
MTEGPSQCQPSGRFEGLVQGYRGSALAKKMNLPFYVSSCRPHVTSSFRRQFSQFVFWNC